MNPILFRKALTLKVGAFLFALLVISSCQISHVRSSQPSAPILKPKTVLAPQTTNIAKPDVAPSYTISFVGDVILHERLRKREEATHEGFNKIWSGIQSYIDAADISYANLEGPVAPEYGGITGFPMFNYPEKIISDLKNSGFDIVSTANNHSLDRQAKGVKKTIENLKKYNLSYSGTVTSADLAAKGTDKWWGLTPLPNSNSYIAWVACTEMTNGNPDKEELVLYCYKDREIVMALVQQLRAMPDVAGIIVNPHWGEEDKFDIQLGRKIWAHQMIDLGAMAIVGSHPHVVQKIEDYTAKDGRKTFIAYSLGNFVSNQPWVPNKTSMMLFTKIGLNLFKKAEVKEIKYIPLWMNRTVDKDFTSIFRVEPVWDFKKKPIEAVKIWRDQLGDKYLLKTAVEADLFFEKEK